MNSLVRLSSAAVVLAVLAQPLCAQETSRVQQETASQAQTMKETQSQERIYGSSLMTQQERNEYQNQMRQLKTEQERAEFRARHHEQMQQRAAAQGKTLPDNVPANQEEVDGRGMEQGQGQGMGMGQGQGMGQGHGHGHGQGTGQGGQSMGAGKGSGSGNKNK
jgi:TolA-binding protein